MYERILVPLDGSKIGEAALPFVEDLLSKLSPASKAEVTLFQVVSSLSHYIVAGEASARVPYTDQELKVLKQKAAEYLEKAAQRLKAKGADVTVRVAVGTDAADEINKAAEALGVDLVAMSTHGRSGISRWAFGSVTDKVLRGGNKPVFLVRAPKGTPGT